MAKEIGSEFWDVPTVNKNNGLFPEKTVWFLSGRIALRSIIQEIKRVCHSVAMPSWCCGSMIKPFVDAGLEVHFYPVYWQNGLVRELRMDCDALFIMDYFGYTSEISGLNGYRGVVIRDVTHSIFSTKYHDADYYFGSLRKWCGVWTGGYAWSKAGHKLLTEETDDLGYASIRETAMHLKNCFINGYVDKDGHGVTDKGYLKVYGNAEELLDCVHIVPAAERDVILAKRIDVNFVRKRHYTNANILRNAFLDICIFPGLKNIDCPMLVPIIVPNGKRDELRKHLIERDIYCPVHWPISGYHKLSEKERFLYDNELSLVCDQRYTEEDMSRMVDAIRLFL